jgi:hypothetical protein
MSATLSSVTPYQIFLLIVLITWPFAIVGLLFLMSRLENYVARLHAGNPREAGLEPIEGSPEGREVTIVFGEHVVGGAPDPEDGAAQSRSNTQLHR